MPNHFDESLETVRVTAGDCDVVFRRCGSGPAMVLLHGGAGSWRHWSKIMPQLAGSFTVWAVDMPGFGDSSSTNEHSLIALIGKLNAVLDQVIPAGKNFLVMGFSFGGLVAAALAKHCPRVQGLLLAGPVGHGGVRRPRQALINWRSLDAVADAAELQRVMRHNLLAHMLSSESSLTQEALDMHIDGCLRSRFHSKPISRTTALLDALDGLSIPQLVIWGEHDVTANPEQLVPLFLSRFKQLDVHVIPGAGHWVQHEKAEEFIREVNHWLTKNYFQFDSKGEAA